MIYTAKKLESMCEVALRHGFANCDRLRTQVNSHMNNRARLVKGDQIFIPPRQERVETGPNETLNSFLLDQDIVPRIEFIREDGHGYGRNNAPMTPAEQTRRGGNFRPEADPVVEELNITNYVSDRGGRGNPGATDRWPAADFFNFSSVGSDDPDHFKVQVIAPRLPASVQEVEVTLYALKPHYFKRRIDGKDFVEHAANFYTRPTNAARRMTVRCRRIGNTAFLRSAYLRLVSTPLSAQQRPTQCLLVSDYWDEPGAATHERFYTEILHHRVEAETLLRACRRTGRERCGVYKVVSINPGQTLHVAIHALNDGSVTREQLRQSVLQWMRRVYAPAQARPVIEVLESRPAPTNILSIANANAATVGRHASGRNRLGRPSQMSFTVDGHNVTVPLRRNMRPFDTAMAIMAAIAAVPALARYQVSMHSASRDGFTPNSTRSLPVDLTIMKPAPAGGGPSDPAVVRNAVSTDRPSGGLGGQTLESLSSLLNAANELPVADGSEGTLQQRALARSYGTPNCINIFPVGSTLLRTVPSGGAAEGIGPHGSFHGHVNNTGTSVFVDSPTGVTRALVFAHEAGHVLLHTFHLRAPTTPLKDAPPAASAGRARTIEMMDPQVLDDVDAHDMCRNISDAPIGPQYELAEFWPTIPVLDGTTAPARTTPVRRLHRVAGFYGIMRGVARVPLDPDCTDIPDRAPQHARRRPAGAPADVTSP